MPRRCKHCEAILLPETRGEYCCELCARQHAYKVAVASGKPHKCLLCDQPAATPRSKYCITHREEMRSVISKIHSRLTDPTK